MGLFEKKTTGDVMKKGMLTLFLVLPVLFVSSVARAGMTKEGMFTVWEDPWRAVGFPPTYLTASSYPLPFYVSPRRDGSGLFDVPVIVDVTYYDPRTCVVVPDYLKNVSWFNPMDSCYDPSVWWLMRSGKSVLDGCNGGYCYGISAACPSKFTILDSEFMSADLVIEGIGSRECLDTGGAIIMMDHRVVGGWEVPQFRVDILVDLRRGFPEWAPGPRKAIVTLSSAQLLSLLDYSG